MKRYEVIFKYHIRYVPSVADGDVWSRAGSHLHVFGNLSADHEAVARRRNIPVYRGYPRSIHLYDGKNGAAVDLELSDRHERVVPYLIFITSIMVCAFYMYKMMLPFWFISLLLGACVALILALLINFFWKISAHAIGIGGLLGGIMGVARIHLINPYWAFIIVILIAGLVGTSRIFLKRHTPMQVYAGFCLGFICTFVASFLSYIYLFI